MSEERELLRETVASLVEKHANPEAVRRAMESERGYDENLWTLLCEQVGVAALVVPEELGGAGGELADAAVVIEELGKGLVPTPLLGNTLTQVALLAAAEPDGDALEKLAEGSSIGAVVFDPDYVVNGDVADVVVAAADGKLTRWNEFTAHPATSMDPTRRLARLSQAPPSTSAPTPGWPTPQQSCWQWNRSVRRAVASTSPSPTPRTASSSAGRSVASRRSSTGWPTSTSRCRRPARLSTTLSPNPARRRRRWPASQPARRSATWPQSRSRCTAASRSHGSTTSSCTSSAPTAAHSCSGRRATICVGSKRRLL